MEESTKKLIKERFKALPQDIKDAILSADLPHQILAISKENTLMLDQSATLETKIMLVMLALESVDDFVNNLQKSLNIDREKAEKIAQQVNDSIILPIREYLQMIYEAEKSVPEPEDEVPEAVRRAMQYEQSKLPKESQEDLLHAIENPHTIPLDSAHTWFPPMATHKGLPELAPENDLAIKEGETVHENKQEKAQESAEVSHKIPITKLSTPSAAPVTEQSSPSVTPPTPQNRGSIIDKKLGGVVSLSKEETEENAKQPPRIDPYREPLI